MKRVFGRPELHTEGPFEGQSEHAQRHVERAEDQRRPHRSSRMTTSRGHAYPQQCEPPDDVQQIVAGIGRVDSYRNSQSVEHQQRAAFDQQRGAQHD
ncbi:MAG TPA: hypothetical protein VF937_01900, partial [Chloroflexota bacterium]